jgi:hypothetical protein
VEVRKLRDVLAVPSLQGRARRNALHSARALRGELRQSQEAQDAVRTAAARAAVRDRRR